MKRLGFIFMVLCCVLSPFDLRADSTPNVPIDDPVYRDIDKLVAAGLVEDAIYGQRPWSRGEIARLITEAMKKEEVGGPIAPDYGEIGLQIYTDGILERLKKDYREELVDRGSLEGEKRSVRIHPLEQVQMDETFLDSPSRAVPANNGLGMVDAQINPLVAYREGRHYVDGNTLGLETTHSAKISPYFSLYARPRFEMLTPNTVNTDVRPLIQNAYGKFAFHNLEFEVGRDSLVWGQGEHGGLILSDNARPLDMIKVGNQSPFILPWIFKHLGPNSFQMFFADMGPEREFPYAILSGYKWSLKPTHFLELGFNHTLLMGGDGAPSIKWFDPISEFFFVRRGGLRGTGAQVADHRLGFDWRLRIPPFRNAEWYFETLWDDIGRETFIVNITQQMAFVSGLYFPRLADDGSTDLRIQYSHLPPLLYHHGTWNSGYSLNQHLLGDESGPDSDVFQLKIVHNLGEQYRLGFESGYANRDSDIYTQTTSSQGGPDRVVKVTDNTTEHRFHFLASLDWMIRPRLLLQPAFAYERVFNFDFIPGSGRNNFLGRIELTWHPYF